jgi:hypothetical protein
VSSAKYEISTEFVTRNLHQNLENNFSLSSRGLSLITVLCDADIKLNRRLTRGYSCTNRQYYIFFLSLSL